MPHCHQCLPFQKLVIQTGSPSDLFTTDSPPLIPKTLSFRGFPSLTPGPLPTLPTLPSLPIPTPSSSPSCKLLAYNFQVRPLITCPSHQLPLSPVAHLCPGLPLSLSIPFLLPRSHPSKSVPGSPWDSTSHPWASDPPGSRSPSPSPAPPR